MEEEEAIFHLALGHIAVELKDEIAIGRQVRLAKSIVEVLKNGPWGNRIMVGDDVVYVGSIIGTVISEDDVKLRDGTVVKSLRTQPQKFRRIL